MLIKDKNIKKLFKSNRRLLNNQIFLNKSSSLTFKKQILKNFKQKEQIWFYQIELIGRSFRLFRYKDFVAFDLGYSNLFLFKNDESFFSMHSDKTKLIIYGKDKKIMLDFIYKIKRMYKQDKYHGKGIFSGNEVKPFYKKLS